MNDELRIAVVMMGDMSAPVTRTKYSAFHDALARRFELVGIHHAELQGFARLVNALQVARPNRRYWRQRMYMNVPAFRACSRRAAAYAKSLRGQADVILQDGVLFDVQAFSPGLPSVIYTDYTARLSARQPSAGRSPFTAREAQQWLAMEEVAFGRAAHVCTWSRMTRQAVIADYGLSPQRVTAVGGGLSLGALPELPTRCPEAPLTVLFIGAELRRKGGDVLLQDARPELLQSALDVLSGTGATVTPTNEGIRVARNGADLAPVTVSTAPFPGFPTDPPRLSS